MNTSLESSEETFQFIDCPSNDVDKNVIDLILDAKVKMQNLLQEAVNSPLIEKITEIDSILSAALAQCAPDKLKVPSSQLFFSHANKFNFSQSELQELTVTANCPKGMILVAEDTYMSQKFMDPQVFEVLKNKEECKVTFPSYAEWSNKLFITKSIGGSGIVFAKDGKTASNIVKNFPVKILITDYDMPGMTGLELIKEIRKNDENLKIVLHTADFAELQKTTDAQTYKYTLIGKGQWDLLKQFMNEALAELAAIKENDSLVTVKLG